MLSPSFRRLIPALLIWLALLGSGAATAQTLTQRWLKTFSDPRAGYDENRCVEIGPDGAVYAAGFGATSSNSYDIRVVKYHPSTGDVIWEKRSVPAAGSNESPRAIAVDQQGNMIVVANRGTNFLVVKYAAADGAVLWSRVIVYNEYGSFAQVKVDLDGNVIATGTRRVASTSPIESDIHTFKFNGGTGATMWESIINTTDDSTTNDNANAMALDASGNVFITGYAPFGQYVESLTVKISGATGTTLWLKQRRDAGTSGSSGQAVALDAAGNCVVASTTPQGFAGLRVVKYSGSDGAQMWVNVQDGPQRDEPSDVAVDSQGNVVVTGYSYNVTRMDDIFTRKINGANGASVWSKTYDGGITSAGLIRDDRGSAVRFDRSDNPVVAGYSSNPSGNGPDVMILRYAAASGDSLVTQRVLIGTDSLPGGKDALAVGPGHVTVAGRYYARDGRDSFVVRLNDPAPPTVVSQAAVKLPGGIVTINGSVNPNGTSTTTRFEYGTVPTVLSSSTLAVDAGSGFGTLARSANLSGLPSGTTYYVRLRADSNGRTYYGQVLSFATPSNNARLASAGLASGELLPAFAPHLGDYITTVPFSVATLQVNPVTQDPAATVAVNGTTSTAAGVPVALPVGSSTITLVVTAEDGIATLSYAVKVTRLPAEFVFHSVDDVPLSVDAFTTGNLPAVIRLEYDPLPGTALRLVDNSGRGFISGRFANLAQGQRVSLSHGGGTYDFVVNYYGGNGNDLELHWADTALSGWGAADQGQLGDPGLRANVATPAAIDLGALAAGRSTLASAGGYLHGLCLFSDGKVAAWGYNGYGQAGYTAAAPVAVPPGLLGGGALSGKRVIAIAAGAFHSLALCNDGSIAAWGYNNHGQLGNGFKQSSATPVAVDAGGVLAGKTVTAIAAGAYHSLALCSDGSVVGWGFNGTGCLGNGSTTGSEVPVLTTELPASAKAVAIAAGDYHSLALGDDDRVAAWGQNTRGQLGDGSGITRTAPVAVSTAGALVGKTVTAIASGAAHGLALCSDGTIAAWGAAGRCGTTVGGGGDQLVPVRVELPAGTAGSSVAAITAGAEHSHARLKDGRIFSWGENSRGQAGDGTWTPEPLPVFLPGQPVASFTALSRGPSAFHVLAIVPGASAGRSATSAGERGQGTITDHEQRWWLEHFGADGGGSAGEERDLADPDHDGVPNLIEYALGRNPQQADAGLVPQWHREGHEMVLRFTAPEGVSGLRYGVIVADRLDGAVDATWDGVGDIGVAPEHHFRVSMESPRRFMRLEVKRE